MNYSFQCDLSEEKLGQCKPTQPHLAIQSDLILVKSQIPPCYFTLFPQSLNDVRQTFIPWVYKRREHISVYYDSILTAIPSFWSLCSKLICPIYIQDILIYKTLIPSASLILGGSQLFSSWITLLKNAVNGDINFIHRFPSGLYRVSIYRQLRSISSQILRSVYHWFLFQMTELQFTATPNSEFATATLWKTFNWGQVP